MMSKVRLFINVGSADTKSDEMQDKNNRCTEMKMMTMGNILYRFHWAWIYSRWATRFDEFNYQISAQSNRGIKIKHMNRNSIKNHELNNDFHSIAACGTDIRFIILA